MSICSIDVTIADPVIHTITLNVGPAGEDGVGVVSGGTTGQILAKASNTDYDNEWITASGTGDMAAGTYDPTTVAGDAFDMDNMTEGSTNKILTGAERTTLGNTSGTNTGDQTLPVSGVDFDPAGSAAAAQAAAIQRANHTGTQTAATIVDFDTEVVNNSAVTANTAKTSYTDATKVAGIETGADVTDTANVTAAGALMNSEVENLEQVKAFDSTNYGTAAEGVLAGTALQPSYFTPHTLTSATAVAWDMDNGHVSNITLGHNATVTISNLADGETAELRLTQAAGLYSLTLAHAGLTVPTAWVVDTTAMASGDFGVVVITRYGTQLLTNLTTN